MRVRFLQCIFTGIKWRILSTAEETILFSLYTMRDRETEQLADTDVKIFEDGRYYRSGRIKDCASSGRKFDALSVHYHEFIIPKMERPGTGSVKFPNVT